MRRRRRRRRQPSRRVSKLESFVTRHDHPTFLTSHSLLGQNCGLYSCFIPAFFMTHRLDLLRRRNEIFTDNCGVWQIWQASLPYQLLPSSVKTLWYILKTILKMFHCLPQNRTMAQYFSQSFPKPGRNVFTLLCTHSCFLPAAAGLHLAIFVKVQIRSFCEMAIF